MGKRIAQGCLAAIGILFCILDSKTALSGAMDGMDLCLRSIVPSIFPFMVLSGLLTSSVCGIKSRILRPLGLLIGIPDGTEGIFLTGLIGGYPIGAQAVHQAWQQGQLSKADARRMLAFCSNAGPSFLFGILGMQFSDINTIWLLWGIHILSAVCVGMILPGKSKADGSISPCAPLSLPQSLKKSVVTMGFICGWVILFRVLIAFLDRWALWILPVPGQVIIYGLLELANGCCNASLIFNEGMRFIICGIILAFGGICVLLQTVSVTGKLGISQYLLGKSIHGLISLIFCALVQFFVFPTDERYNISAPWILIITGFCVLILTIQQKIEKKSSNPAVVGV